MSEITEAPTELPYVDDLTIITAYVEEYSGTSTHEANYTEYYYYRIPVIAYILFTIMFLYIGGRICLELIIRWRKK